jgi:uncharacterized protein YfaS (alpha-2-macroglobulin family)
MSRFLYLVAFLALAACSFSDDSSDDFSSPKYLFVDHISSHTGGVISVGSPIRVRFTRNLSDSLTGVSLNNVFRFSPSIPGEVTWEDSRTLVFTPNTFLPGNERFEATLNVKELIPDIDSEKEKFNFVFQTLEQNYDVTFTGLKFYQADKLNDLKLEGFLQTADVADKAQLEKIISASQDNKPLKIVWGEVSPNQSIRFSVENVQRKETAGKLLIETSGDPIEVDKDEKHEVEIPALGDYKVTSSMVMRGAENYISVLFSDPLDPRQNLAGLIALSNTTSAPRVVINLNELKIYPTEELSSDAELTLHQSIKNIAGYPLKENYLTTLQFTQAKPEVRLTDSRNASILPNADELILPFEAVGLNSVDVTIIRVFEDNMLQYLQVNALGGQNELRRVGKPVATKTIPLNTSGVTDLNSWNRFNLDLKEIFQTEPGAFYQIRIGFQKHQSLYFCADDDQVASLENLDLEADLEEEESYWDSYDYYYNPDFNWEERDNPCSSSYYGNRRSVSKMLMSSDFGIIAKKRDGGDISIFVTSLMTTKPIEGATVEIYDYQQQLLATEQTNGDGFVSAKTSGKPFTLIVKKNKQTGYLKIDDGSALSLSNFNVTGQVIQKGIKGFIYGERGVWRPADTVHLAFILEDKQQNLPVGHPVIMELYNPAGQLSQRKVSSEGVGNMYRFDFVTDREAPTGNWKAKASVGGASFQKTVKIETIKPNRLKINLTFDKEKFSASDSEVSGNLDVRWLSGATASNLKVEYEAWLTPVKTTFDKYPNFSFDDRSKVYSSERELVYEGKTDASGKTKVSLDLGDASSAPGALKVNLYGKVYEEGGDFSISNTTIPYYPYESFVGVKIPEGDKRGMLLTDQDHKIRIATVNADGSPVSRKNVEVEVYKVDWKWWWDNSYDDISNYVGRSYRSPVAEGTVSTINGEGNYTLRINHPEWGRYYVRVTDPVSGHSAGEVVYFDWPGWAGKGKRGDLEGATMLDFAVEKEEYTVGEKIAFSIPSTAGNRLLVSLETGSELLQTFWVETTAENTVISVEATPDMAPNIYAHLTMIQPHGQTINDLPIRLYGVKSIKVVDKQTILQPLVSMPKELRPGQEFNVQVSEKNGKVMSYTLAIVDEGLLDITNFNTPSPWEVFYAREALGIKTWDVYDDVMGAFAGSMDHLLAIGGDDFIEPKEEKDVNRFKPVVKYLGPFSLKKGETKKHIIKMPQYIGSVKTMVVAARDGAYGNVEVITPVNQPLMVLATLPRVAGPGESIKLPVNVFALQDNIGEVTLTIETSGALTPDGKKTMTTQLAKAGDKVVFFDIKALPRSGTGKVKVIAKSATMEASYDVEMNVIPRNPRMTAVTDYILPSGENWTAQYSPLGMAGENQASLEISTMPPLNIGKRLKYLIQYPHGCIEQTVSAVFAQLFVGHLMDLSTQQEMEIQRNVDAAIKRLSFFQLPNGGFTYWPGNGYANSWGTNYAGHFLLEAKSAGYAVPEGMLSSWARYQTGRAEVWNTEATDTDDDLIQAYRLYTLALGGAPALGAMNRMKENSSLRREAKWRLALAYAEAGYSDQAKKMTEGLALTTDTDPGRYGNTFGSATRDQAMILETLLALDKKEQGFSVLQDLAREMGNEDRWMSTQTTAYCFIAISKYAKIFSLDENTNVLVTSKGEDYSVNNQEFINQIMLKDPDQKTSLQVSNRGQAPVYVRLIRTGIPLEGGENTMERNIRLNISYQDMNGVPVNVASLSQGTNFKAIVTVSNPGQKGDYEELALTQIFPSGWEIINTRLDGSEQVNPLIEYKDIRDDRVMHYFDLKASRSASFEVLLNAAYRGRYYLPAQSVGAMYDNDIYASKAGEWVEIVE